MKKTVIALAALATALAGCASSDRKTASQDDPTSTSSSTASMSSSGNTYGSASNTASNTMSNASWSGVVIAVDPILRQDAAAMGVGMAGAAAAGGTLMNEGSPNDKVYRITMRADDGTTQVVVVDSVPTYKSGDRVRYRNGSVLRE
jgi:outer membrane lipoprotein SlyB